MSDYSSQDSHSSSNDSHTSFEGFGVSNGEGGSNGRSSSDNESSLDPSETGTSSDANAWPSGVYAPADQIVSSYDPSIDNTPIANTALASTIQEYEACSIAAQVTIDVFTSVPDGSYTLGASFLSPGAMSLGVILDTVSEVLQASPAAKELTSLGLQSLCNALVNEALSQEAPTEYETPTIHRSR